MSQKSKINPNSAHGRIPIISTNSVREQIAHAKFSQISPVDFLNLAGRYSEEIRMAIVDVLTNPIPWISHVPPISSSNLVKTIHVAEKCASVETPHREYWRHLASVAGHHLQVKLLSNGVTPEEIRIFRRTMKELGADVSPLEDDLHQFKAAAQAEVDRLTDRGKANRKPRKGRHINEQNQRKLVALFFLEQECEYSKTHSRMIVTEALYRHGVKIEADSLRKLLHDYEAAQKRRHHLDRIFSLSSLMDTWLCQLGRGLQWFLQGNSSANPPYFCKRLLSEELRPHWDKLVNEFKTIQ